MRETQLKTVQPQNPEYILAVIHHPPAQPPNEAEVLRIIQQYRTMNWHMVERNDSIQPFEDGYTMLKFCK